MCGTIKYEGVARKIGDLVPYNGANGIQYAPWLGHSRQESAIPPNSTPVSLPVDSYTEKGVPFAVPTGKQIDAYLVSSPNFPQGKGIFIITRPVTDEEKKLCTHPRHPRFK